MPDEVTDEDLVWLNDQLAIATTKAVFSNPRQPRNGSGAAPGYLDRSWVTVERFY